MEEVPKLARHFSPKSWWAVYMQLQARPQHLRKSCMENMRALSFGELPCPVRLLLLLGSMDPSSMSFIMVSD